jgi:hypothetical protein
MYVFSFLFHFYFALGVPEHVKMGDSSLMGEKQEVEMVGPFGFILGNADVDDNLDDVAELVMTRENSGVDSKELLEGALKKGRR